jgi:dTDP-glucose pyrophosphorylase
LLFESRRSSFSTVKTRKLHTPCWILLPAAKVVYQPQADGVANALLLAQPFLDHLAIVTLGDLFFDGAFGSMPLEPALVYWRDAPPAETRKNFGIATTPEGAVSRVIEKPVDGRGLRCGMGGYVLSRSAITSSRRTVSRGI